MQTYDVLVIGAGPIGLAVGIHCQRLGLQTCVIERGCITDALYRYPTEMTFFSTAERIAIAGIPFPCPDAKPDRRQALAYYRSAALSEKLPLQLYTRVTGIDGEVDAFIVHSERGDFQARRVVLATGFFEQPVLLGIPGEDRPNCSHYFSDAHPYADQDLLIVGGANSAVIAALACWRAGARVTLVHRGATLYSGVKYWLRPDLEARIGEGSIDAHFDTRLTSITDGLVELQGPTGTFQLANDFVLALTGYRSDTTFLQHCGVSVDEHNAPLLDPDTLESRSRAGLHLCGCVCGGDDTSTIFIENARLDAERLAARLRQQVIQGGPPPTTQGLSS